MRRVDKQGYPFGNRSAEPVGDDSDSIPNDEMIHDCGVDQVIYLAVDWQRTSCEEEASVIKALDLPVVACGGTGGTEHGGEDAISIYDCLGYFHAPESLEEFDA